MQTAITEQILRLAEQELSNTAYHDRSHTEQLAWIIGWLSAKLAREYESSWNLRSDLRDLE